MDDEFVTRFWSKVQRTEDHDQCWLWTGGKTLRGYGTVRLRNPRRMTTAHRVAWVLTHGDIPDTMDVCHTCDNPACCNLNHLFVGTRRENMMDASAKGRLGRQPREVL